ncbi:33829_t:CDS:1, partial [Racocetra persica]
PSLSNLQEMVDIKQAASDRFPNVEYSRAHDVEEIWVENFELVFFYIIKAKYQSRNWPDT